MLIDLLAVLLISTIIGVPMVLAAFVAARITNRGFRFSLRSLLIAMTLVALVLGLAAYLANQCKLLP